MMSDAISRIAVLETLCQNADITGYAYKRFADEIKELPALDVAPVVHARWAHFGRRRMDSLVEIGCSHCGFVVAVVPLHEYSYEFCPRCGAKMDGEADV